MAVAVNNVTNHKANLRLVDSAVSVPVEVVDPAIASIGRVEAKQICQQIKHNLLEANTRLATVRSLINELDEGKGYLSLGYDSLRQMWENEIGQKKSQVYRYLSLIEVEKELGFEFECEAHHRPLTQLASTEQRQAALEKALKIADSRASKKITEAIVREAVKEVKGDRPAPTLEEVHAAFSRYGKVTKIPSKSRNHPDAFQVVRFCRVHPDRLEFLSLKGAIKFMQSEKWEQVQAIVDKMGEYDPQGAPWHCMSCVHANEKFIDGERFYRCDLHCDQYHESLGDDMAAQGCWISAHDENAQAIAEMARTTGRRVQVEIDGQKVEAIALHVRCKYICPRTGEIRYESVPLNSITTTV